MNEEKGLLFNDKQIVSLRGNKNETDPLRPYAWLIEKELSSARKIEDIGIIFLTNRECTFHCLMCDLWKNTTDHPLPLHAVPDQIEWALKKMPGVKHLKLYNSGSFFDERAIPEKDYRKIAGLLEGFETVIVESHPKLIGNKCLQFRDMLKPELQIAMGLETVNPDILRILNKQMTTDDFKRAADYLSFNGILSRAFILLKPPLLSEAEGIHWAERSIRFAFDSGVECCTIIPVRPGNGTMDKLMETGDFSIPDIHSLEKVLEYGIGLNSGRVFADTWDLGLFSDCDKCLEKRTNRLIEMNLTQKVVLEIDCDCIINESHFFQEPSTQHLDTQHQAPST